MKALFIVALTLISSWAFTQEKSSLLWEVSKDGIEQPSYLFGTIHMIAKKDFFFTDVMRDKFNSCDKLVLEIDMSTLSLKQQIEIGKKAILNNGQTLQSLMGDSAYHAFFSYVMDSLNIKEKKTRKYNRLKPFYITGLLLKDYVGKIRSYETQLTKYSKKQKMELGALETIAFQMSLVDELSLKDQAELFLDAKSVKEFDDLVQMYIHQDLNAMYESSNESYDSEQYNFFVESFINKRNNNWIPLIEDLVKTQATFIAVGALHLPGEKGVIALLRSRGYTVTPVL